MTVRSVITARAARERQRAGAYRDHATRAHRIWQGGRTEAQAATIGVLMGTAYRYADAAERYETALRPGPDGAPAWVDRMDAVWGSEAERLGDEQAVPA